MLNLKTNLDVKNKLHRTDRIKLIILFAFWYSLIIFITVSLTLYYLVKNINITIGISFVLLLGLFLEILFLTPKLSYYDMLSRYYRLLYFKRKPFNLKSLDGEKIDKTYKSYHTFVNDGNALIKYLITDSKFKKTLFKTSVLEIVTFIKDPSLPFFSDILDNAYKQIYQKFQKQYRINKQVIIQFKAFPNVDKEVLDSVESIICYKEKDNYLITINAGFSQSEKKLYLLCSDIYAPNFYYNYGVQITKKIL